MKFRWNEYLGVDGTLEILWCETKIVDGICIDVLGYRTTSQLGTQYGVTERNFLEDLINRKSLINIKTMEPIQYIKKFKLQ